MAHFLLQEELLVRRPASFDTPSVEYHILLSATYRVPMLHFNLRDLPHDTNAQSMDIVYDYLVPPQYKSDLRRVGVLGGISLGNHPIFGTTWYFVHPCNTAEALRELGSGRQVTVDEYLMLFLGVVGSTVGLYGNSGTVVNSRVPPNH